jgi:hypothetical protein
MKSWGENQFRAFFSTPGIDDWLVTFAVRDDRIHSMHVQESPWAPAWYDDRDNLGVFARRSNEVAPTRSDDVETQ